MFPSRAFPSDGLGGSGRHEHAGTFGTDGGLWSRPPRQVSAPCPGARGRPRVGPRHEWKPGEPRGDPPREEVEGSCSLWGPGFHAPGDDRREPAEPSGGCAPHRPRLFLIGPCACPLPASCDGGARAGSGGGGARVSGCAAARACRRFTAVVLLVGRGVLQRPWSRLPRRSPRLFPVGSCSRPYPLRAMGGASSIRRGRGEGSGCAPAPGSQEVLQRSR